MKRTLRNAARTLCVLTAAALSSCAEEDPFEIPVRLKADASATLSGAVTLAPGAQGSWSVSMPPTAGTITLRFDGRIDSPSGTAGNSPVLEITVNGQPVSGRLHKGPTYSYPNRGGTEPYYDDRGRAWGQPAPYWGLFWSPDFVRNDTPTDPYYVAGGSAYDYVFDVTQLVSPGRTITITIANQGGWVKAATGTPPTVVLRDVVVSARWRPRGPGG